MLGIFMPLGLAAPRLKIEPPAKQITIDQSVILKIQLEWPQSEDPYEINSLEPKLENITLENQNQSQSISSRRDKGGMGQSQETGGIVSHTLLYEFHPMKAGTAVIYPFEISYRKTETDPWVPILIPEQKIEVVPAFFRKSFMTAGFAALTALVALIIAGKKITLALKAREAARSVSPPDPKQRVYAKAEESIATFTSPDSKFKLTHWSNQLRIVVATYYDVSSKSAGTEVLSVLKTKGLGAGEWNEISRLFEQLTEMQFSRQDIPAYDLEGMQKTLLQYVKGKIIIGNSNS